jgi:hypothetical protein
MNDHASKPASQPPSAAAGLPCLAFVHIPKCAGQSIQQRLAAYYGEAACLRVGDPRFGADIRADQTPDAWREVLHNRRVVYGHYDWPSLKHVITQTGHPGFKPISLVREPLERAISEYWYIRGYPEHPKWTLCQEVEISEYLGEHHAHNCQCRLLSGTDHFSETKAVIEQDFEAIAPVDEIDAFAQRLASALGHTDASAPHVNRSAMSQEQRGVGPRTTSHFYANNAADLALYWWTTRHWRSHWRLGSTAD